MDIAQAFFERRGSPSSARPCATSFGPQPVAQRRGWVQSISSYTVFLTPFAKKAKEVRRLSGGRGLEILCPSLNWGRFGPSGASSP